MSSFPFKFSHFLRYMLFRNVRNVHRDVCTIYQQK